VRKGALWLILNSRDADASGGKEKTGVLTENIAPGCTPMLLRDYW